jgi:hypothetical protein
MADHEDDAPLSSSFFEGRVLVEILSWEWALGVGPSRMGRKDAFQGGLDLVRTVAVTGRVQAPQEHRGREIHVRISPFGPEVLFGRGGLQSVGSLAVLQSAPDPRGWQANLLFPEADLATLAVALSTTTKYLHIWTCGLDVDVARITNYSLSSTIAPKVKPWAGVE